MITISANPKLIEGNERFRRTDTVYKSLAEGQHPEIIVLACSDSRVGPERITDSDLGRQFVIRAIGGAVDQSVIASIEYPVEHLKAKELAIMGHTKCGAVTAAQQMLAARMVSNAEEKDGSALATTLMGICRGISGNSQQNMVDNAHAVIDNAMSQAKKLVESSRIIRDALAGGALRINIWLYDISTGELKVVKAASYDEKKGSLSFEDLPT